MLHYATSRMPQSPLQNAIIESCHQGIIVDAKVLAREVNVRLHGMSADATAGRLALTGIISPRSGREEKSHAEVRRSRSLDAHVGEYAQPRRGAARLSMLVKDKAN